MNQLCEYCRSEIDSDCYVCPVCKKNVNVFRLRRDNPFLKWFVISVAMIAVAMLAPRFFAEEYFKDRYLFQGARIHQLKIVSHQLKRAQNEVFIIGEIKNDGKSSFTLIEVEARLYGKDGELIDIEKSIVTGGLEPGESRTFKISRCCIKDGIHTGLGEFEKYEVSIVNGFIKKM